MKLTVLVPVFNEAKTILKAIEDAKKIKAEKEIIVIDNGSTDGTQELLGGIKDPSLKIVIQDKNYGYGNTMETGLSMASGEYVYIHMSDLEYRYSGCLEMLKAAEELNLDAVFGSRFKKDEGLLRIITRRRENIASLISSFLINKWYKRNFRDVLGSRLYRRASVLRIPISTHRIGFEFEHSSRMCKQGFRIKEVEIEYSPRKNRAEKKIKPYHIFIAMWTLFRVRYCDSV